MKKPQQHLFAPNVVNVFAGTVMMVVAGLVHPAEATADRCRGTVAAWRGAVTRIAAGEVRTGVRMLDSLRRHASCSPDSFFTVYAQVIAGTFLPDAARAADSAVTLSDAAAPFPDNVYFTDGDAEVPEGQRLTVTPPADPRSGLPSFAFDRFFTIRERFKVWLPPLREYQHSATAGLLRFDSCRVLPGEPLLYHPAEQPWKVHLKIVVDCSEEQESLYGYVGDLVISRYDYIRAREEQAPGNAVSLRCYTQQVFHSRPGTFLGLVAFDRYGLFRKPGDEPGAKGSDRIRIRYLIMVKANRAVEEKAELLLRRTVEPFRR